MNHSDILAHVDHTLLAPDSTWEQIRTVCDDGIRFGTASVCIPADFVARASEYAAERVPICTVIGFPTGYSTTEIKCAEAAAAVRNGADEVDMVINIGRLKDGQDSFVLDEIRQIKSACGGRILKVIIETCLLTEEEKIRMCHIVSESGADFIKTSTGFSKSGATPEDVALFAGHVASHVKIKAAGGIRSFADAENYLNLGASRLGTSALVKILKSEQPANY
ncbi:MAG: deoxyribose-phosphate aldolase [Ruminococcaceae bacterium]|nr:deoxyribose-phosphate aldolase [Oscillospiraceae bacterium]